MKELVVLGAGGHAKVVLDALLSCGMRACQVFDDDPRKHHQTLLGYTIEGGFDQLLLAGKKNPKAEIIVAVGKNKIREKLYKRLQKEGFRFGKAIHAKAVISSSVVLGEGTMVMANVVINPEVSIAENVIINTGAIIEHDCNIGAHSHIAPNATICGEVKIGVLSFIGAGAVIMPGVAIGKSCVVGAGAVVTKNLPDHAVVAGIPARPLGEK